jgi:hypothetical protein
MSDEHLPISSLEPPTLADAESVLYVFLLVVSRNKLRVSQIALDGSGSSEFIKTLRKEYFKNRGTLRSTFSVWRFSHCNFVKVCRLELPVEYVLIVNDTRFSSKEHTRMYV